MEKVFNGITIIAIIIIVFWLFNLDYSDLSWNNNARVYLSIIALVLIGASLQFNKINLAKKRKNKENE